MNKKKNEVMLLLAALGVLIAFVSYYFVFMKFQDQTAVLETANTQLKTDITYLEGLLVNEKQYTEDIETMNAEMDAIITEFPSDFKTEDGLLFAIDLKKNAVMEYSQIDVGGAEPVYQFGSAAAAETATAAEGTSAPAATEPAATEAQATDAAAQNPAAAAMCLNKIPVSLTFQVGYNGLKTAVDYVSRLEERKTIDSVSVSFDKTTGKLVGTMAVNVYTLSGTDKAYEAPVIPDVPVGTGNLFGTIE
ncbi:hypothetical protein [Anaerobium acetethylicum]|uniref:Type IV pilus assembly protein PilO n=1 Tax=Anaerobium acetethylicum TaxID=1619234 RepID=A0A1D3TN65_9FIRM|nr:hypothetical protein [Anaerobium acetethylicum]SCP94732.1 hypothetical protein SAMN05421730_10018 [Anaerobium acetethylicum]